MSVFPAKHPLPDVDGNRQPYRAVPLSTRKIAVLVSFLALYSFVYLSYAQHHKALFFVMTGAIVVWIGFVYCAGILAVLYMVRADYKATDGGDERENNLNNESSI